MVSNFHKHFLKHLSNTSSNTQNDTSIASRTSFKKSSLLTSYFSKTDANKNVCKDLDTTQNEESERESSSEYNNSKIIPIEDTEEKTISETVVEENNSGFEYWVVKFLVDSTGNNKMVCSTKITASKKIII